MIRPAPRDFTARVTANQQVGRDLYHLAISPGGPALAGQFAMLKAGSHHDPLLRRPFSLYRADDDGWHFLYRVVGRGTGWLAQRRPGDAVQVLGPLGNGFPLPAAGDNRPQVLVGGGIGVAPLPFLAHALHERGFQDIQVFLGFRSRDEAVCLEDFPPTTGGLLVATEDGSLGKQGLVTAPLAGSGWPEAMLYVCGPTPMMRAVAHLAHQRGWQGVASLETAMACGIGACVGCVVPRAQGPGYVHVCKEGPVFDLEEIAW